jgi:hypothetical protein
MNGRPKLNSSSGLFVERGHLVRRRTALLLSLSLFGTPLVAAAQSAPAPTCALHAQVTDEDGGPITRVFILIHSDYGTKLNQQVNLDPTGRLKISLRRGLYSLFVSSPGFVPIAQIVDLRSCKPLNLNLMMLIDSDHMEIDEH